MVSDALAATHSFVAATLLVSEVSQLSFRYKRPRKKNAQKLPMH